MSLGADHVKTTHLFHFFAHLGHLVFGVDFADERIPLFLRHIQTGWIRVLQSGPRHRFRVTAHDNVGTTTGHVRRDRDGAKAARLSNDVGFTFMVFGVEDFVLDAAFGQQARKQFTFLNRCRTNKNRTTGMLHSFDFVFGKRMLRTVHAVLDNDIAIFRSQLARVDVAVVHENHVVHVIVFNFFGNGFPFVFLAAVDDVRMSDTQHRLVRRNRNNVKLIDLVELFRFGHRRTGHAADFIV